MLDDVRGTSAVHSAWSPRFERLWDPTGDPGPSVLRSAETGLWLIRRSVDIRRILVDVDTFRPDNALDAFTALQGPALRTLARADFALPPTLANNGTASHLGLRRLVAAFFTPARITEAVPLIRRLTESYLDELRGPLEAGSTVDLAAPLARDLPARVLLRLLRIDDVDLPRLKAWSTASLELFWGAPQPERQRELAASAGAFHRWLRSRLASAGDAEPSLFAALRRHRLPGGDPLSADEAVGVCYFLLIAGQETTTQLLAGLLHRVLDDPGRWRGMAAATPGVAATAVEDFLRHSPPVPTWRRIAARDTVIDGVHIPAGARLLLLLGAAGADENERSCDQRAASRTDAARTRPHSAADRTACTAPASAQRGCPRVEAASSTGTSHRASSPNTRRHLAFGHGPHFCLGAELARTEAITVLETVAAALPGLHRVEPTPPELRLLSFRAPQRVLVRQHLG
ncbi:cytochrome P450 family protein [Actinoalloteichus hymeniacidonis]|uniref:Cytochrome P450 n=1 Tax=Actinoalloteichus hymeniacidonis TaxID=340345 RepID=A0AAC9HNW6_9PSEU|nr:cytochrome P450 [Actinoalloteichus hymeniacidonis]AOS62633.1 cytochrome P450 [Actinoalloteichus hymeniacidonis]MBB5909335.1 cytochrome P450 [Actinoalloteichus hymeniacidonis]